MGLQSWLVHFLLVTSVAANPFSSEPLDKRANVPCPIVPKPATLICGGHGQIKNPAVLRTEKAPTLGECATRCAGRPRCVALGFDSRTKTCRMFTKGIQAQGFTRNPRVTEVFWNRNCFVMKSDCSISTSSVVVPTTTATPTEPVNELPTTPPASVYNPPVPTSFAECLVDPTDADLTLRLLDPEDGIPIINNNGRAAKTTEIIEPIPEYIFVRAPGTPDGIYDLMLNGQYLAFALDGRVIFTSQSSGQKYITAGDDEFITSLFSYDCEGALSFGIPGVVPFEMGFEEGELFAQPILDQYNPESLSKRGLDYATRQKLAQAKQRIGLTRMTPVVAPSPTFRIDKNAVTEDRCPNVPVGLVPYVRDDARDPTINGCGSTGISTLVPNYKFEQCCNAHDLCYDDCDSGKFLPCNSDFKSCNRGKCQAAYPGSGPFDSLARWGCENIADFYAWSVSSTSGREAFSSSTKDRCGCNCGPDKTLCNGSCIPVLDDPNNCGSCGNVCPSGQCINSFCYVEPEVPAEVEDPCDSANFLGFSGYSTSNTPSYVRRVDDGDYDMRGCCNVCRGQGTNCLAWQWFFEWTDFFSGATNSFCNIVTQTGAGNPGQANINGNQCPAGGGQMSFSGLGSMLIADLTYGWEPGPCAVYSI